MQVDDSTIVDGATFQADLCMIGAGPAGVTLACEIARSQGLTAILIEAGGRKFDASVQEVYQGSSSQPDVHATPDLYRRRQLGGSSTIWGGRCVPFDDIDFRKRAFVANSGWPIAAAALKPYYSAAMTYCEAGYADFDADTALPHRGALMPGLTDPDIVMDRIERFSPPTNFGRRYAHELKAATNVRLILDTTATAITDTPPGAPAIISCETGSGKRFLVEAAAVVVCVGGLETVRTLKHIETVKTNDNIGRYYMCHIESTPAALRVAATNRDLIWNLERTTDGVYARRRFALTENAQERNETLNTVARLHYSDAFDPGHKDPILSSIFLTKRFLVPEYRRKFTMIERAEMAKAQSPLKQLWPHAQNVLRDMPGLVKFAGPWFVNRHLRYRRIPLVALKSKRGVYPLDINAEQVPNPDSRVTLNGSKDRFGIPRLHIDWRTTEQDTASLRRWLKVLQRSVRASGAGDVGGLDGDEDFASFRVVPVGGHHIGTARMAESERNGVVDQNLKCFGSHRIYVAGSAVFPTSGSANPTLTIVALAVRLADHLKEKLSASGSVTCH